MLQLQVLRLKWGSADDFDIEEERIGEESFYYRMVFHIIDAAGAVDTVDDN